MGIYSNYITESTLPINEGLFNNNKSITYKILDTIRLFLKENIYSNIKLAVYGHTGTLDFDKGKSKELLFSISFPRFGYLSDNKVNSTLKDIKEISEELINVIKEKYNIDITSIDITREKSFGLMKINCSEYYNQ